MTVYIACTDSRIQQEPILIKVYKKSSYQKAYNWLADIAERHGGRVHVGDGKKVAYAVNQENGQTWWIDRHECE